MQQVVTIAMQAIVIFFAILAVIPIILLVCVAIGLFILLILSPLVLAVSFWAYKKAFYSPADRSRDLYKMPDGEQYDAVAEKMHSMVTEIASLPYEQIFINSYDGLRLSARYYHVANGAPVHIQVHGYKSFGVRDFCGGNQMIREAGHNSLIIDHRAHGDSEGKTISFGIKERRDVLTWIEYINDRFGKDTEILLWGVSMGAATVLMASGLNLPENVCGILADCPYSSPWAIVSKVAGDIGLPKKIIFPFVWLGAAVFGRFNILECSAVSEVKKTRIPILLVHGDDDRFVPLDMSRQIAQANTEMIKFRIFNGAGHALSYLVCTDEYKKEVADFLRDRKLKYNEI